MLGGLSVRKAVERLHHKPAQQRQLVNEMRERADALTAGALAANRSKWDTASQKQPHQNPCFVEVTSSSDLQRSFSPDCMLSGVAIGVSDTLDVRDFGTRYGTQSQLLQQMPQTEFPFVSWLRRHGAQFVGKLACKTPLTIDEASLIVPDNPAAVAVSRNACNYAISSALMGPAALTSPLHYPIAAFKPTAQSFTTFTGDHRLSVPSMSFGITAGDLDDIFYLWEVFTSAIQPASFFCTPKNSTPNGDIGAAATTGAKNDELSGHLGAAQSQVNASVAPCGHACNNMKKLKRSITAVYSRLRGNRPKTREEGLMEPHVALSIGYPADWIDALCQEGLLSADDFRRRILSMVSTRNVTQKAGVLKVIPLTFDIDLEEVVRATQTIGLYELSQAFDRLFSWNAPADGMDPCVQAVSSTLKTGVLEELPEELVSAIFNGRALTSSDYHRALRTRDSVARAAEDQFRDVDFIITPMLSEPYVNSSMRSIALLLPFSLGGNPMISLQLKPDFPVVLVGELGRDTGLFEDSTTFLQFVQ